MDKLNLSVVVGNPTEIRAYYRVVELKGQSKITPPAFCRNPAL